MLIQVWLLQQLTSCVSNCLCRLEVHVIVLVWCGLMVVGLVRTQDNIVRMRWRNGGETPELITPGTVYNVTVEIGYEKRGRG